MQLQSLETVRTFNEERFTKTFVFQAEKSSLFVLGFLPGQTLPAHRHPGSDLYLLVLEGKGILSIDDTQTEVAVGDAISVASEELMSFANTGDTPVRLYVAMSKH